MRSKVFHELVQKKYGKKTNLKLTKKPWLTLKPALKKLKPKPKLPKPSSGELKAEHNKNLNPEFLNVSKFEFEITNPTLISAKIGPESPPTHF